MTGLLTAALMIRLKMKINDGSSISKLVRTCNETKWMMMNFHVFRKRKKDFMENQLSVKEKSSLDKSGLSESLNLNSWCGLEALSGLDNWTAMFEWMIGQKVTWLIERNPPRCETFCTKLSPEVFILIKHHEVFLLLVFFLFGPPPIHKNKTLHYYARHVKNNKL